MTQLSPPRDGRAMRLPVQRLVPRLAPRVNGWLAAAAIGLALTGAGVLWVTTAHTLAAQGLRINQRVTQRQDLLQRRAAARLHLAAARHPARLEARARDLGFAPHPGATRLLVAQDGQDPRPGFASGSPLAIQGATRARQEVPRAAGWRARLAGALPWPAPDDPSAPPGAGAATDAPAIAPPGADTGP